MMILTRTLLLSVLLGFCTFVRAATATGDGQPLCRSSFLLSGLVASR
jgi:hypothetical protein